MTTRIGRYGLALCCVTVLASGFAWGQQKGDDKDKAKGEPIDPMAEKMAHFMEYMPATSGPGPEHEHLKRSIGKWDVKGTFYMPGMPPDKSTGTCEFRSILGGRFIVQEYRTVSDVMGEFSGFGINGFDRIKGKYVSVWMDSMGTGIYLSEGTADPSGKKFTYMWEGEDPMTRQNKKSKMVTEEVSDD
ncbi:MAG: DUF1579 domain-containing protein, partial [Planctomycetes bacterium]|nr:DUF1579 domain-containing protein [Planctomycetota bacterium]